MFLPLRQAYALTVGYVGRGFVEFTVEFTEFGIDKLMRVERENADGCIAELNRSDLSKLSSIYLKKPDSFQNKRHEICIIVTYL